MNNPKKTSTISESTEDFLTRMMDVYSSSEATVKILKAQLEKVQGLNTKHVKKKQNKEFHTIETGLISKGQNNSIPLYSFQPFKNNESKFNAPSCQEKNTRNNVMEKKEMDNCEVMTTTSCPSQSVMDDESVSVFLQNTRRHYRQDLDDFQQDSQRTDVSSKVWYLDGKNQNSSNDKTFTLNMHEKNFSNNMKLQCRKLESTLMSLQSENIHLKSRLGKDKLHSCSSCKNLKASFDEINQKLQNCETKKIELRLENKKLKQIVELNLQEINSDKKHSGNKIKIEDIKEKLKHSYKMIDEGMLHRQQLHKLLAEKEEIITKMQVRLDTLELALKCSKQNKEVIESENIKTTCKFKDLKNDKTEAKKHINERHKKTYSQIKPIGTIPSDESYNFLKCQNECCMKENLGNSINGSNLKDPIQAEITRLKLLDDDNDVNDVTLKINDVTLNNEFTIGI